MHEQNGGVPRVTELIAGDLHAVGGGHEVVWGSGA